MNNVSRHISTLIAAAASLSAAAAEPMMPTDSLTAATVEHASPISALRSDVFANPAMQSIRFASSLNTLYAAFQHSDASQPVRLEDGDQSNLGLGRIDAYLHRGNATIWGTAEYRNGKYKNIQFCETSDYEIVAPYFVADTVGGDTDSEYYHFLGGFSYPVGRFNIGAEGEYTARLEYRTRDPRPKNLTGDLKAKVGTSLQLDNKNLLGIAATARKYKQTNEIELYNEVSVPIIYHLTGLSTDYYRFRGQNTDTYYKGYAWGGMITYSQNSDLGTIPLASGWFAAAAYDYMHIEKIISDLNQLPMAETATYSQSASIGYSQDNSFGIALTQDWCKRKGTENIFGSAVDNIYPQISEAKQYSLTKWSIGLNAAFERKYGVKGFAVSANAKYSDFSESYLEPARSIEASAISANIKFNGHITAGHVALLGYLYAGYEWSIDSSLTADDEALSSTLFTPVAHYYNYLDDDRWSAGGSIEAGYNINNRIMPFLRFSLSRLCYTGSEYTTQIEIAAGIRL